MIKKKKCCLAGGGGEARERVEIDWFIWFGKVDPHPKKRVSFQTK